MIQYDGDSVANHSAVLFCCNIWLDMYIQKYIVLWKHFITKIQVCIALLSDSVLVCYCSKAKLDMNKGDRQAVGGNILVYLYFQIYRICASLCTYLHYNASGRVDKWTKERDRQTDKHAWVDQEERFCSRAVTFCICIFESIVFVFPVYLYIWLVIMQWADQEKTWWTSDCLGKEFLDIKTEIRI